MKNVFTIIMTIFFGVSVFATTQIADKIIHNSQEYNLFSNSLESFFNDNPDKRPAGELIFISTMMTINIHCIGHHNNKE